MELHISTSDPMLARLLRDEGAQRVAPSDPGRGRGRPVLPPRFPGQGIGIPPHSDFYGAMEHGMMRRGGVGMGFPEMYEMVVRLVSSPAGIGVAAYGITKAGSNAMDAVDKALGIFEKIKNLRGSSARPIDADIVIPGAGSLSETDRSRLSETALRNGLSISFKP